MEDFPELLLAVVFSLGRLDHSDRPFFVHKVRGARPASGLALNAMPVMLEVLLDELEAVESGHLFGAAGARICAALVMGLLTGVVC